MIPVKTSCTFIAATLLLAACNSAPRESSGVAPAQPASPAPAKAESSKNLRKGMTEAEIRAVWGKPKAVHAGEEGETVLVYQFDVLTSQKLVATSMVEVPAYDPVTGEYRPVQEAVLTPQNTTLIQTIVLRLRAGRLDGWARQLGTQRTYN